MAILQASCIALGGFLFNFVGGPLFDKLGPNSPFILIGTLDVLVGVFAVVLCLTGRLQYRTENKESNANLKSPEKRRNDSNTKESDRSLLL